VKYNSVNIYPHKEQYVVKWVDRKIQLALKTLAHSRDRKTGDYLGVRTNVLIVTPSLASLMKKLYN
jgi:hypothetical protein